MTGKYDPTRHPDAIAALARRGLTNEEIAHDLGISYKTLKAWKKRFVAVGAALKEGKAIADGQIETSLFRLANGYRYSETKIVTLPDGRERIEVTEKEVQPNVTAIIFYLKNRRPDLWRDHVPLEGGDPDRPILVKILRGVTMDNL